MPDRKPPPRQPIDGVGRDIVAKDVVTAELGRSGKQTAVAIAGPTGSRLAAIGTAVLVAAAVIGGGIFVATQNQPKASLRSPGSPAAGPTSTPPATQALNQLLVIKALGATLNAPVTIYSVVAEDAAGGDLSYSWTMTPTNPTGRCGTPMVEWTRPGPTVPWSHALGPPDNCPHLGTDHPVKAQVTITVLAGRDKGVMAECELVGSESQKIESPATACRFSL